MVVKLTEEEIALIITQHYREEYGKDVDIDVVMGLFEAKVTIE